MLKDKLAACLILTILLIVAINKLVNYTFSLKIPNFSERSFCISDNNVEIKASEDLDVGVEIRRIIATASKDRGKMISKRCISCHSFNKGGGNKIGPNLFNIVDSSKCSSPDYRYSSSIKNKKGKWTIEELAYFLNNPKKYIDGTKMMFPGIKDPKDLADLIKYMESNKD